MKSDEKDRQALRNLEAQAHGLDKLIADARRLQLDIEKHLSTLRRNIQFNPHEGTEWRTKSRT